MAFIGIYKCINCAKVKGRDQGDKLDYPPKCDVCGIEIKYHGEVCLSKKWISKESPMFFSLNAEGKVINLQKVTDTTKVRKEQIIKGGSHA